jgi:hypothetical protein
MEAAPTRVAMHSPTVKVAADVTTIDPAPECRVRGYGRHASVVATSRIEARTAMETMEPRPGANKDPAGEPLGSIEAVRCAGVRIIVVVAVRAHRSRPHVNRSHAHLDANGRGLGVRRNQQAETQQR